MIPEIGKMRDELNSLLAEKENEFKGYCPERIKNAIFNMRNDIKTFSDLAERAPTDLIMRDIVLADYGTRFNKIKSNIGRIRIKGN